MELTQFCYTLNLRPDLLNDDNWTEEENQIVEEHFLRLQADTNKGTVIMAGRTLTNIPEGFGIVVLRAENEENAREYMDTDPAVKAGVMTAQVFPFRVALIQADQL